MTDRSTLLASIANTIRDYRAGEITTPSVAHVETWIQQFDPTVQDALLDEVDHVLKSTYFSRQNVSTFVHSLSQNPKFIGADRTAFWNGVHLLEVQGGGASQRDLNALLRDKLNADGIALAAPGGIPNVFVYLDDGLFTGNRIRRDLERWISNDAPNSCTVHIVVIALHSGGFYYAQNQIRATAQKVGKSVTVKWWFAIDLEDRRSETDNSDVLRPTVIPADVAVQNHVSAMQHKPVLRQPGQLGPRQLFSGEAGRHLLEQEMLKAGVRIRALCPNLGQPQRPLGNSVLETLGFGSMIVTYRNCPNNAPLALWAGDPWYPLFVRKTNTDTALMKQFGF
jgi:hypothetical protein